MVRCSFIFAENFFSQNKDTKRRGFGVATSVVAHVGRSSDDVSACVEIKLNILNSQTASREILYDGLECHNAGSRLTIHLTDAGPSVTMQLDIAMAAAPATATILALGDKRPWRKVRRASTRRTAE